MARVVITRSRQLGGVMRTTVRSPLGSAALLLASVCYAQTAPTGSASTYPTHPVRMLVLFAGGGPTDVIARVVAQKLSEKVNG